MVTRVDDRRDRGQTHTLEAISGGLVLLTGLILAIQMTAVTPLTASTANQYVESNQRTLASDVLLVADENGTLTDSLLFWNGSGDTDRFVDANEQFGFYVNGGPPTEFGATLNRTFAEERIAFNVEVVYQNGSRLERVQMVNQGTPSDNAVSASHTVVLYDNMSLTGGPNAGTELWVLANDEFYAPDEGNGPVYNVVEVRITVWQN